jgi:hypothetical protein
MEREEEEKLFKKIKYVPQQQLESRERSTQQSVISHSHSLILASNGVLQYKQL